MDDTLFIAVDLGLVVGAFSLWSRPDELLLGNSTVSLSAA